MEEGINMVDTVENHDSIDRPCTPTNTSPLLSDEKTGCRKENSDQSSIPATDRTFLIYKTFYLLFFAGFGSTFPYLAIYFKQLGLNASYVGTLSGVRPLVQFVSGPLWAYIADKYRSRKLVLCMSVVAWLVMTLALAIPQPRNTRCEKLNTTDVVRRNIYSTSVTYPSLPLSALPAVPEDSMAARKSTITFSVSRHTQQSTNVIVHDKTELRHIFYILLILIVVGEFFEAPSFVMIDTALIQQLGDKCHDYGKTRLFGSVGYGLASFGVGAVLDTTSYVYCGHAMNNYMVIFYFFVGFMTIGLVFVSTVFSFRYNSESATCSASSIFSVYELCFSLKYASFLLTVWFMGMGNGGQVTFINWYLEDLGASKFVMGFATSIRCSAVVMGFFFSGSVIDRLGAVPTVFWSLVVFSVVFFGYSYLTNPWMVIPLEILQGLVYSVSWSTCIVYLSAVTPDDGAATMQSILQGVYWGLGTGIGAILGGFLVGQYGLVWTYRICGIGTVVVTVQFMVTQWLIQRYETPTSNDNDDLNSEKSRKEQTDDS